MHQRLHGIGAEEPGLDAAPGVEQAVGEDVPPLAMRAQLDLVDGDEVHAALHWHGLDGADEVASPSRDALLFAGHQRHVGLADFGGHAVVDLAGQQAQRQTDHAGRVLEHALDGAVRLARVGGPEQGRERGSLGHAASLLPKTWSLRSACAGGPP